MYRVSNVLKNYGRFYKIIYLLIASVSKERIGYMKFWF